MPENQVDDSTDQGLPPRDKARQAAVQEQEKPPEEGQPQVPHGRVQPGGKTPGPDVVEEAHNVPSRHD